MGFARNECAQTTTGISGITTESWGQGFMVGGLLVIFLLTLASMRKHVLLHQLIALEVFIAAFHGTFVFPSGAAAGWYTSATAVLIYLSYNLHNAINWMKIRPFLSKTGSVIYIGSFVLVWPYWVAAMYFNFAYNNNLKGGDGFPRLRPWEPFCREPWWLFTTVYLLWTVQRSYSCGIKGLIRVSPKFGILIIVMFASLCFIISDIVTTNVLASPCKGENPFWKIALVLKCLSDAIFLDDFKSVLDRLSVVARTESNPLDAQLHDDNDKVPVGHCSSCSCQNNTTVMYKQDSKATTASQHLERSKTQDWFDRIDLD